MFAGVCGAATLVFCGLAILAAQPACDYRRPRTLAVVAAMTVVAIECGYQVQVLHDECRQKLLFPSRPGLTVVGGQLDRLSTFHAVLLLALVFVTFSLVRRCVLPRRAWDAVAGLFSIFSFLAGGGVFRSTFPVSIFEHSTRLYFLAGFLVGVPTFLVLLVSSLFLLLRRPLPCGVDNGYPLCLSCGYNLTGNMSGLCPECGAAVPFTTTVQLAETPANVSSAKRWPRGIARACYGYAFLWLIITIGRQTDLMSYLWRRSHEFRVHCSVDVYAILDVGRLAPIPYAPCAMNIAVSLGLALGAYGLGGRRRWGLYACWAVVSVAIPLAVLDGIMLGSGWLYAMSPGVHTDVEVFRIAFVRAVAGAGFPIFLSIWLLQRHVRMRIASWTA